MSIDQAIQKIEAAGFHLAVDGADILVTPPGKLTDNQRAFIKGHKQEIVSALKAQVLGESQAGNDIQVANDELALIHVPELTLSTGRLISCDMTVPVRNLPALRKSLKFVLKDGQGGGSILGEPGKSEGELREILTEKYGNRLATVDGFVVPTAISVWTVKDLNDSIVDACGETIEGEFTETTHA